MNTNFLWLLPSPKKITEKDGSLTVTAAAGVRIRGEDARLTQKLLSHLFSGLFTPAEREASAVLQILRDDTMGVAGAYTIEIGRNITVTGSGFEGIANGLQTLKKLTRFSGGDTVTLPCCAIEDAPYKPIRGVHFYMPPAFLIDEFCTLLDELAALKYNTVILETGGGVELERHPEVNYAWQRFCREAREYPGGPQGLQASEPYWKDSTHVELCTSGIIRKDELRRIADHARMLGMEIIPEIQALSHAYYLTLAHPEIAERPYERWPDSYCPMCEESYTLYFDVADEICQVLQPRRVSIGHDEIRVLGECPRCRGKSGHELLAYDLNRLHDFYSKRGISILMWGEMLQNFTTWKGAKAGGVGKAPTRDRYGRPYRMPETYLAADRIPKDILMLDWYYSMSFTTEQGFREKGFSEIFGNFRGSQVADWDRRAASPNVLGAEVSTWCVPSEYEMSFNGWLYELVFSAMVLWQDDYNESRREAFSERTENYMPLMQQHISGKRLFDGSLNSLDQLQVKRGKPGELTYRFGTIGEDTAKAVLSGGLTPLEEGEALTFGGKADAFVFFHATDGKLPQRLTTWNFRDKTERIPARYAIDYEDGMCVVCQVEFGAAGHYGVAIGNKYSRRGYTRPDLHSEMLSDIDDANTVNEEKAALSPMFEHLDEWRTAMVYSCRFAELDTPDGIRTVYASEWKNPYKGSRIKAVRFINEETSDLKAELYAVGIATQK